jgi:putative sterol carrier protein
LNSLQENLLQIVESRLNEDPTVLENTRRLNFNLTLGIEGRETNFFFKNGSVKQVIKIDPNNPRVIISGSYENWLKIVNGLPGGLHRAFRHRILKFEGDYVTMLGIWKTIWRLGEALSSSRKEKR